MEFLYISLVLLLMMISIHILEFECNFFGNRNINIKRDMMEHIILTKHRGTCKHKGYNSTKFADGAVWIPKTQKCANIAEIYKIHAILDVSKCSIPKSILKLLSSPKARAEVKQKRRGKTIGSTAWR